jgi:diguanylate cyclase (GGDEF)-like protein
MNWIGRSDKPLIAGLTVALLVVFSKQVRGLLDFARDVEQTSGVALLLPLIILTVVFFFQQHGKRQEEKARAALAEAETREAQERAAELEQLVVFGQALGRSLDLGAIRDVVLQHLATLTGTTEAQVVIHRDDGQWQMFVDFAQRDGREVPEALQALAEREAATFSRASGGQPVEAAGVLWWPMAAGGDLIGFLGVPEAHGRKLGPRDRVQATAATLLAISLRTARLFGQVKESSLKDGLTGCFNRTHGLEVIDIELRRARRSRQPLSLIMFDIDRFKTLNDQYGHLCGDRVLATVGQTMRDLLRSSDLKCRYGGEEFLILLPETPVEGARRVADTLRRELSDRPVFWQNEPLTITASFGVAAASTGETDVSAFISRADAALYQAKDQGRNRVCLSAQAAVV